MKFIVLKCFQCSTFQVHQSKKSRKWVCKLCGAKQSLLKVYFEGTSSDCRKLVQDSNMKQGMRDALDDIKNTVAVTDHSEHSDRFVEAEDPDLPSSITKAKRSKWDVYKPSAIEEISDEEKQIVTQTTATTLQRNTKIDRIASYPIASKRAKTNQHHKMEQYNSEEKCDKNPSTASGSTQNQGSSFKNSKWSQFHSTDEA